MFTDIKVKHVFVKVNRKNESDPNAKAKSRRSEHLMERWRDKYRMERFDFEGREAIIVFPNDPDSRRRWVLKEEYFPAFQDLEERLVENGFHLQNARL